MRESDGPNSNIVGEKLCKHKYSAYPYCYGEITTETQGNNFISYNTLLFLNKLDFCFNQCRILPLSADLSYVIIVF